MICPECTMKMIKVVDCWYCPLCDEDIDDDPDGLYWEHSYGDGLDKI